ncbi:Inosine-5'-monophosphate dehydrogenase [Acaryochloris thomasi RCC1774]|uniref:Inosine-5'-monophosphate dehydrogenase n=1 Tax=Acaryochloris thomasi RCC1774 TaxID=1764569 RepID=A0A2W1JH26_9CYAN|nr:CBS domain-containing protein [Acaryochloris thomasi]PZD72828.1 Inosine-5'-monophosphate dehydrogenase [Acaryochloris thomasi RCC1774]
MIKASEIMTREVVSIQGSATVADAVKMMKEKSLRALIVEPRYEGDPYGIVSETDIVSKVAAFGHAPKQMWVYEVMTKPCIVVPPDLGLEYVARLFANTRIRRAPVVEGKLLGVISVSDILRKGDFVEKPKELFIEDKLEVAREEARTICAEKGPTARECAAAWDVVEEMQAAAADQRTKQKVAETASSSFEQYCADNPNAKECRIYDD